MKCIKDYKLTQFLDGESPGAEVEMIETHLSGCDSCRTRLQRLRERKEFVELETGFLDPVAYPEGISTLQERIAAVPETVRSQDPGFWKSQRVLRPVAAALVLAVLVAGGWFLGPKLFPPDTTSRPTLGDSANLAGRGDIVRYVRVDGHPAQTYIIKDPGSHTTIIWVEPK